MHEVRYFLAACETMKFSSGGVAGRSLSTAAQTFIDAVRNYDWRGRIAADGA